VVVTEDGKTNLIEMLAKISEDSRTRPRQESAGEESKAIPVTIDVTKLLDCSAVFRDRTLTPPFTMAADTVDGTITGFSSTATAGAAIDVEARVRSGGSVIFEGEMDLFDPKRFTDLAIDIRQADMPPASPMAVRYLGHPFVAGEVDIDLDYEVTTSQLTGNNRIVTHGLELGDKVEGEGKLNLPFKLGVSLLTDKNGLITLEIPVEGDLDDPDFKLDKAIGSAVTELTGELVKSPFRLLGRLGGGSSDQDFDFVEFRAGSARLESKEQDKLRTLAAGAEQRPQLVLLVEPTWDADADANGLKEAAFEARVAEQEASLDFFESMYLEAASHEQLDALRSRNTVVDESTGEKALDETAYYRDLRDALIDAQPVNTAEVEALAVARAETIRNSLVDDLGVDPARVRIIGPAILEEPSGDDWVRCRLDVEAPQ
jgi:hypothetical protein